MKTNTRPVMIGMGTAQLIVLSMAACKFVEMSEDNGGDERF
jgi:hypothetical protein